MRLPKDKNGTIIQEKVNTMVDAFMKQALLILIQLMLMLVVKKLWKKL